MAQNERPKIMKQHILTFIYLSFYPLKNPLVSVPNHPKKS